MLAQSDKHRCQQMSSHCSSIIRICNRIIGHTMSQLRSTVGLVILLILAHYWTAISLATTTTKSPVNRFSQSGSMLRAIDGMEGSCGKAPGSKRWTGRDDAFCGNGTSTPERDRLQAEVGEFPSSVLLEVRYRNATTNATMDSKCLGVLVHNDLVLTANGCLGRDAIALRATAGLIGELASPSDHQRSFAWGFCRLRNKATPNSEDDNDVVLVQLRKPFIYNNRIQPACVGIQKEPNPSANCYLPGLMYKDSSSVGFRYLASLELKRCVDPDRGPPGGGLCFQSALREENFTGQPGALFTGAGLYCLDNCTKDPTLYVIGVNSRDLSISRNNTEVYERASVSRTYENRANTIKMLEGCHEFVKE